MRIAVLFTAFGRFQISVTKAAELTLVNCRPLPKELINHFPYATVLLQLHPIRISQIQCRLIDLPGLIKGSWEGKGLGTRFLSVASQADSLIHRDENFGKCNCRSFKIA
jgi:ribosome-binding ATPase YchF (GTP1/OBG family)